MGARGAAAEVTEGVRVGSAAALPAVSIGVGERLFVLAFATAAVQRFHDLDAFDLIETVSIGSNPSLAQDAPNTAISGLISS